MYTFIRMHRNEHLFFGFPLVRDVDASIDIIMCSDAHFYVVQFDAGAKTFNGVITLH